MAQPTENAGDRSRTILVVEDEESIQRLVTRTLTRAGFKVVQATTAQEATDAARDHGKSIDLLLTDEVMPGFSGIDLAVRMRKLNPRLKVVCMSGFIKEEVRESLAHNLISAILEKPFAMERMLEVLKGVLEGAGS